MHKTNELAKELGVTVYRVNSWIRKRRVSAIKLPSGHYMITDEEFERIKRESIVDKN